MVEEESAKIKEHLLELAKKQANTSCADCGEKEPQWASANLGIFLCIVCAGIHRNLGVHISRVKSLMLDIWKSEELEVMRNCGNNKANEKWEGNLCETSPIQPTDSVALREQWIRAKYVRKLYAVGEGNPPHDPQNVKFPAMEGYMVKMGDIVKNWRKRLFRLSGSTLFYYKPQDATPAGFISMVDATRTPDCLAEPIQEHPYCFVISTPGRDYYLCAETGEAMYDWIQMLRTARRYMCTPHAFAGYETKARDVSLPEQVMPEVIKKVGPLKKKGKAAKAATTKCILGSQVVDLLIHTFRLETRQEAVVLGQVLVEKNHIKPSIPEPFMDGDKIYYLP